MANETSALDTRIRCAIAAKTTTLVVVMVVVIVVVAVVAAAVVVVDLGAMHPRPH